jgi:hypothetical protein
MFDPANNSVTLLGQTQEARVGQKAIVIGEHSALLIRGKVPSAAGQIEESRTFEYFSGEYFSGEHFSGEHFSGDSER